jgi:hypothetical protein
LVARFILGTANGWQGNFVHKEKTGSDPFVRQVQKTAGLHYVQKWTTGNLGVAGNRMMVRNGLWAEGNRPPAFSLVPQTPGIRLV